MNHRQLLVRTLLAVGLVAASAAPAAAQAFWYPAFQAPRTTTREFNFGLADVESTVLAFQWREGISPKGQLSLDAGLADAEGASAFFFGGGYAHQLTTETIQMPLAFLLTAGVGFTAIDPEADGADGYNILRVPVGVVMGHRFPLEGQMSITPYVHPRLSFESCGDCAEDSEMGVEFDIGADFTFNPQLSMRFGARFGGTDYAEDADGFGISLAWRPGRTR